VGAVKTGWNLVGLEKNQLQLRSGRSPEAIQGAGEDKQDGNQDVLIKYRKVARIALGLNKPAPWPSG
jgi:hypothetical protein